MNFVGASTKVGIKNVGQNVIIPGNPWAKLMHYLDCAHFCIDRDRQLIPERYTDHDNYHRLTGDDKLEILKLCSGPLRIDNLVGKIFFIVNGCGINEFYEIERQSDLLALGINAQRVIAIGASTKQVATVMIMNQDWMFKNFVNPLREITNAGVDIDVPSSSNTVVTYDCCLTYKSNRKWLVLFFLGLLLMGYGAVATVPSHVAQEHAFALPDVSTWNNNITNLVFSMNGTGSVYARTYIDNHSPNSTGAINIINVVTSSTNVLAEYARGSYPLLYRSWTKITPSGEDDLLSDDSYVYFRFTPLYNFDYDVYNATFIATFQDHGSKYWPSTVLFQEIWFGIWVGSGFLFVVIALIAMYKSRR